MAKPDLTLWGAGTSRIHRVHWMLAEMQLDYGFHPIHPRSGQTSSPEFQQMNPRHKVPVLRHGEVLITQSAAILQYLGDAFAAPEHVFTPTTAAERAKLNEWCFFCMTELDAHSLYVIRRHKALAHVYGEAPEACRAAQDYFIDQLGAVSGVLENTPAFLLGDRISCADILFGTCLDWAKSYGFDFPDSVLAYHQRVKMRDTYQRSFKWTYLDAPCGAQPIAVTAGSAPAQVS